MASGNEPGASAAFYESKSLGFADLRVSSFPETLNESGRALLFRSKRTSGLFTAIWIVSREFRAYP